jgi:hypothetical protein
MVGGSDQHRGSATEATLVMRWAHGDSGLQGEGKKARCP